MDWTLLHDDGTFLIWMDCFKVFTILYDLWRNHARQPLLVFHRQLHLRIQTARAGVLLGAQNAR